jgi:hypothetical protein
MALDLLFALAAGHRFLRGEWGSEANQNGSGGARVRICTAKLDDLVRNAG